MKQKCAIDEIMPESLKPKQKPDVLRQVDAGVIPTAEWDDTYWDYNLPLQMWLQDKKWRATNYMPRKSRMEEMEELISKTELPQYCKNAASILRNLANLFEALGKGEIDTIYYPTENIKSAIAEYKKEKV